MTNQKCQTCNQSADACACSQCPWCGETADLHDGATKRPNNGAVSVCWRCRNISLHTNDGRERRLPTSDELAALMQNPDVRRALAAVSESYTAEQANALYRGGR